MICVMQQPKLDSNSPILLFERDGRPSDFAELNLTVLKERITQIKADLKRRKKILDMAADIGIVHNSSDNYHVEQKGLMGWLSLGEKKSEHLSVLIPDFLKHEFPNDKWNSEDLEKFSSIIFNLFANEMNFHIDNSSVMARTTKMTPLTLLAHLFTKQFERAIDIGLPATYNQYEMRPSSYRGRLVINRLVPDLFTQPHRLMQNVNVYDNVTPVNQLLKWCCDFLSENSEARANSFKLQELSSLMKNVPAILPTIEQRNIMKNLPPLLSHLQECVNIARIVAEMMRANLGHPSAATIPGLVFNANDLFENYCRSFIQDCLPEGFELFDGNKTHNLWPHLRINNFGKPKKQFEQKPDVVIIDSRNARLPIVSMVLDVKNSTIKFSKGTAKTPNPAYRNQTIVAAYSTGAEICGLIQAPGERYGKKECFSKPEEWDLEDVGQNPKRFIRFTIDPSLLIDQSANDAAKKELKEELENYLLSQ